MAVGKYDPQWNFRDGNHGEWEIRTDRSSKQVKARVEVGDATGAKNKQALLVSETGRTPAYIRIDAIPSPTHVQVVINGKIVADSRRPVIVYEAGQTPRYYIPVEDARMDLLAPSEFTTQCPYKGVATYWHAHVLGRKYSNVVWSYRKPLPGVHEIARLLCFYNEQVDAVYIDGRRWILEEQDSATGSSQGFMGCSVQTASFPDRSGSD
jgi:Uncharacterized protein conserved in bacteria